MAGDVDVMFASVEMSDLNKLKSKLEIINMTKRMLDNCQPNYVL